MTFEDMLNIRQLDYEYQSVFHIIDSLSSCAVQGLTCYRYRDLFIQKLKNLRNNDEGRRSAITRQFCLTLTRMRPLGLASLCPDSTSNKDPRSGIGHTLYRHAKLNSLLRGGFHPLRRHIDARESGSPPC